MSFGPVLTKPVHSAELLLAVTAKSVQLGNQEI